MKTTLLLSFFMLITSLVAKSEIPLPIIPVDSNQRELIDVTYISFARTCDANKKQFKNINRIQIGDMVIVPAGKDFSVMIRAQKGDCLWTITKKARELFSGTSISDRKPLVAFVNEDFFRPKTEKPFNLPLLVCFIAFAIACLSLFLSLRSQRQIRLLKKQLHEAEEEKRRLAGLTNETEEN